MLGMSLFPFMSHSIVYLGLTGKMSSKLTVVSIYLVRFVEIFGANSTRSYLHRFRQLGSLLWQDKYWETRSKWWLAIRSLRRAKAEYFRNKFRDCFDDQKNKSGLLWKLIKNVPNKISELVVPLDTWVAHFNNLLKHPFHRTFVFRPRGIVSNVTDSPISMEEIEDCLMARPTGKKGGPDRLDVKFWRDLWSDLEARLWILLNFDRHVKGEAVPVS